MKIIGVTGLTGSGKSRLSQVFRDRGAYLIDADETGHKVLNQGGTAYNDVVRAFGSGILAPNGDIDRKALGRIVFADPEKLALLSELTHKHILSDIADEIDAVKTNPGSYKAIVLDVILLFESGLNSLCDVVILVTAGRELRLSRIITRDNLSAEAADARLARQGYAEGLYNDKADYLLDNNGGISEFIKKSEELAEVLLSD